MLAAPAFAQVPDEIVGTEGGAYGLFTPNEVLGAALPPLPGNAGACLKVSTQTDGIVFGSCATTPAGGGGNLPTFIGAGKVLTTNASNDGAEWDDPSIEPVDIGDQEVQALTRMAPTWVPDHDSGSPITGELGWHAGIYRYDFLETENNRPVYNDNKGNPIVDTGDPSSHTIPTPKVYGTGWWLSHRPEAANEDNGETYEPARGCYKTSSNSTPTDAKPETWACPGQFMELWDMALPAPIRYTAQSERAVGNVIDVHAASKGKIQGSTEPIDCAGGSNEDGYDSDGLGVAISGGCTALAVDGFRTAGVGALIPGSTPAGNASPRTINNPSPDAPGAIPPARRKFWKPGWTRPEFHLPNLQNAGPEARNANTMVAAMANAKFKGRIKGDTFANSLDPTTWNQSKPTDPLDGYDVANTNDWINDFSVAIEAGKVLQYGECPDIEGLQDDAENCLWPREIEGISLSDAAASRVGTASSAGTDQKGSRGDHVHRQSAGSELASTEIPNLITPRRKTPSREIASNYLWTASNCAEGNDDSDKCEGSWKAPPTGTVPALAGANKHLATNAANTATMWVDPPQPRAYGTGKPGEDSGSGAAGQRGDGIALRPRASPFQPVASAIGWRRQGAHHELEQQWARVGHTDNGRAAVR